METYASFIRAAKNYANSGESQRLNLMMLLLDIEPRKSLWQANPNKTLSWETLLREEGLCTPTLFGDFKRATKMELDVKLFGVYAAAAIVKLPPNYRSRVIRQTSKWIGEHKIKPTYQRITKYVSELKKELGIRTPSTPMHQLKAENNRLQRKLKKAEDYIGVLKTALRNNNIRIPREPT
jgi:hypothetical protein